MKIKIVFTTIIALLLIAGGYFIFNLRPAEVTENASDAVTQIDNSSANFAIYRISQDESKALFMVDEVLRGEEITAVGETNQIAGDISVSLTNQSEGELGQIIVNARALKTDSERRDGAISKFILKSTEEKNQFITFVPVTITPISVGATGEAEMSRYSVDGNLTMAGVTKLVTFNIVVQDLDEKKIVATAETVIQRSDFRISIPSVEFVAGVSNDVTLRANVVAYRIN
jgi:polyisoprenoid-binding protein YceI